MAEKFQRRSRDDERGGFQRKQWRDRENHSSHNHADHEDRRSFSRDDRGGRDSFARGDRRSFNRDDRGDRRSFNRDDRGDRRSFSRDDRGDRRSFNRDDRGGRDSFARGDRRSFNRDDRGDRRNFASTRTESRKPRQHDSRQQGPQTKTWSSTDRYESPAAQEPVIPAGVSADELDHEALRALETLSGPNRDIVARFLVMAGQLIDIDPELAHTYATAAAARAGRVDVVREATALTAYASGRYEEALREVRAVRRMRGDNSLRAIEVDSERALGRPEKAVEIIEATDPRTLDMNEQVELVLVSSGARADLGQSEVGLLLVDDALTALPADADSFLVARLMSVKADRLRELGRNDEADEIEAAIPDDENPDIIDIGLIADADVDDKRSTLRGSDTPLSELFDAALIDLDGTAYSGKTAIPYAAEGVIAARAVGMETAFVTNNAARTPEEVAKHLTELGHEATTDMVMTSSMDVVALMSEHLNEGARVLVIGSEGLRQPVTQAGYIIVESADEEPEAVIQGLDKEVTWERLNEAAFAIQKGAAYFATNLDSSLPVERGEALGNGALVRAVQQATRKRPIAAGKPQPGIYRRGAQLVESSNPIAVGDRLETDIMGAVAAGIPSLHVLTGVHDARAVITAPKGQRPSFLAIDMRGLNETHPIPKHHTDGTWTCGYSQIARADRYGKLSLDGIALEGPEYTVTLDSYRALAAAAWEYASEGREVTCPLIHVVPNDDPNGIVKAPEPAEEPLQPEGESDEKSTGKNQQTTEKTPTFLPGEEELAELLGPIDNAELDEILRLDDEDMTE
ncbi:HAD-IIA family hydrolase [Schaalia sp. lx-100]|uniref:HAD-IIA family hydrolase n=1 Tax=Schaalia sp. lx-100 TaxID=2899081 RepID=UPI001E3F1982|nr:HAD-IIA family hydrolase [Schaalia sp. lx-100]MCD4556917.1 HAD-IIA family hydrolase [Schaalia sp. lx-100]